jgi:erythrocyte band 7 integral membrane protein
MHSIVAAEGLEDGMGTCGWILIGLSWMIVVVTFPFSIIFCLKVGGGVRVYARGVYVQVVQEYERAVIFRLGRLIGGGAKGPGIFFVLPCIETYTKVDLRTVSFDVPPQEVGGASVQTGARTHTDPHPRFRDGVR